MCWPGSVPAATHEQQHEDEQVVVEGVNADGIIAFLNESESVCLLTGYNSIVAKAPTFQTSTTPPLPENQTRSAGEFHVIIQVQ
jgi:hypothetical protein